MSLLGLAIALLVGGGVFALLAWHRGVGSTVAALAAVAGCAVGAWAAVRGLAQPESFTTIWAIPYGQIHVAIDPLSAFFLVPVFAIGGLTAVYGRAYLGARSHGITAFAFNLLVASMACVVIARQAVLFLVSWEVMSLSAYVLITVDHEHAEVRRAGWVYLIATHIGAAALVALFLIYARHAGSFDFDRFQTAAALPWTGRLALTGLALLGFGVKAGIVPLHVWLPEAHAAAPSHVSALMSAVLVKVGLYGLLRVLLLLGRPTPWLGPSLMVLGLVGGWLGISLALYQRDLKRALAYSTVENMGIILLGVGTGFWGATANHPVVAALGMTGALLHVWNHAAMKGLMFLGAGGVLHGAGSKDLERLGGLVKRMPLTAGCMITGAIAIAALPPLNGFVSEWLIYLGLAHGALVADGAAGVSTSLAVGVLSLIGGLAVFSFVRLIGIALLGQPRSESARHAHEPGAAMTAPLVLLAAVCVAAAVAPRFAAQAIAPSIAQLLGRAPDAAPLQSLATIGKLDAILIAILLVAGAIAVRLARGAASDSTWGCGYAQPTSRMQYTGRSFSEHLAERMMPKWLGPRVKVSAPKDLFPGATSLTSDSSDPVTRGFYEPFISRWGERFMRLRWLQQGVLQAYLVYILVAALAGLSWVS
ncbi:MAG TPA: proton-conducting transporter membrane subunit, partial [Polyangiaceae bacterium]|nr:proton-conducting transporter membrane subunit [Polyangiaceae bacterium]